MLNEKLKKARLEHGMSQEKIAELLGVSRQAVTKWETGQSAPSSEHLIALSRLYGITMEELIGNGDNGQRDGADRADYNPILRANLTRVAIVCQTVFLNTSVQDYEFRGTVYWGMMTLLPLFLSSLWMASNLRFEKDRKQQGKNARIELVYCIVQCLIALTGYYSKQFFLTALLLMTGCLTYIFHINPRYMNRQLVRKKNNP